MNTKPTTTPPAELYLAFHGRVIDHLGIQMYQSPTAAIAELVANAWDADAEAVDIAVPAELGDDAEIVIRDTGCGMTFKQCQTRFLDVGRNPRGSNPTAQTNKLGRPILGRKGIGKFAGFGIARVIEIETTSEENGEMTRFELDVDALRGDSYHAEKPADVTVLDYLAPNEARREKHGTVVRLKKLNLKQRPSADVLARGLARRFSLQQRVADFALTVNGQPLPSGDGTEPIEFEFPRDYRDGEKPAEIVVGDDGYGTEALDDGEIVRWRFVFYKDTIGDPELQGVSVFVGGKLAQAPFYFDLSGGTTAQAGQPYLSGRVEADFLDQQEEDLIATERQRINWEHEASQALLEWGEQRVRHVLGRWGARRKEQKMRVITEKLAPFARRIDAFQRHEQRVVRSALEKVAAITALSDQQFVMVAESMVVAWENGRLKDLITSVSEASDLSSEDLISILVEANVLTALATAEAVKTKLLVVEGLRQRIVDHELENELRDYIADNPWLLGAEWELYRRETKVTNLLRDVRKAAGLADPEKWPRRLDLALRAGRSLLVVEFMRPGVTVDEDHLNRYESYVRRVRLEVEALTKLGIEHVDGLLVADNLARNAVAKDKIKDLVRLGMKATDWSMLLAEAAANWTEYFSILIGRGPEDDRLRKLAEDLDIPTTPHLVTVDDSSAAA